MLSSVFQKGVNDLQINIVKYTKTDVIRNTHEVAIS
jgi:hypothetical protein